MMKTILQVTKVDVEVVAGVTADRFPTSISGQWQIISSAGEVIRFTVGQLGSGRETTRTIMIQDGIAAIKAYRVFSGQKDVYVKLGEEKQPNELNVQINDPALTLRFYGDFSTNDSAGEGLSARLIAFPEIDRAIEVFESDFSSGPRCLKCEIDDPIFATMVFNHLVTGGSLAIIQDK